METLYVATCLKPMHFVMWTLGMQKCAHASCCTLLKLSWIAQASMSHPPALANCCGRVALHRGCGHKAKCTAAGQQSWAWSSCLLALSDRSQIACLAIPFWKMGDHATESKPLVDGLVWLLEGVFSKSSILNSVGCGHHAQRQTSQMLAWQGWPQRQSCQFGGAQNAIGSSVPQKIVQYLYHFLVSDPFNWTKKPPLLIPFGWLRPSPPAWQQQRLCEKMPTLCHAKVAWSSCQIDSITEQKKGGSKLI